MTGGIAVRQVVSIQDQVRPGAMVISVGCARIKVNRLGKIGDTGAPFAQGIVEVAFVTEQDSAIEISIGEIWRSQHPLTAIVIVSGRAIGKPLLIFLISLMPVLVTSIRRAKCLVWNRSQVIFDLVHVPTVEAPVIIAKIVETRQAKAFNAAGHVDVRVEVTPNQLS